MFKIVSGTTLPEGRWITPVPMGFGDGRKKSFELPGNAELGRYIAFVRSFRVGKAYGDTRYDAMPSEDGRALVFGDGEDVQVPEVGAGLVCVLLDEKPDEKTFGLQVRPMTTGLQAEHEEALKKEVRRRIGELTTKASAAKQDRDHPLHDELQAEIKAIREKGLGGLGFYRITFGLLVTGWSGVADASGNVLACNDETKRAFMDQCDGGGYGSMVMEASQEFQSLAAQADRD